MAARAAIRPGTRFLATFCVTWLAVVMVAALVFATLVVPQAHRRTRDEMARQLGLLEDVRASAIRTWCRDILADARTVAGFPTSRVLVSAKPTYAADPHFGSILDEFARLHDTGHLVLFDASGRVRASSAEPFAMTPEVRDLVRAALASRRDTIDIHPDAHERAWLLVVALTPSGDGAVVASHDPQRWLYPLLASAPRGLAASDAVLLRREGSRYRVLSPTADARLSPLALLPGKAGEPLVYDAGEGFAEGVDETGERVMAESRTIPGPEWRLVCKVDAADAFEHVNHGLPLLAMQTALLLTALTALGFALVWGQRRALEAQVARKRDRLAVLLDEANEAMGYLSADGRIAHANRSAEALFEVAGGLVGQDGARVLWPGDGPTQPEIGAELERTGRATFETEVGPSGAGRVPVEVSLRSVTIDGERNSVFVVRDLTARREAEAHIRRLNRLLRATSAVSMAIGQVREEADLFERTCRIIVDTGGFRLASIVMRTAVDRFEVVQYATDATLRSEQLEALRLGSNAGHGPSVEAITSGRALRVADLMQRHDWRGFEVVRDVARVRSSGSGLIVVHGEVRGALTLFEPEPDAFDDESMGLIESVATEIGSAIGLLETQRAHARLEQRLAALFTAGPVGFVVANAGGVVTHANAEFLRMAGRSEAELEAGDLTWTGCLPGTPFGSADTGAEGASAAIERDLRRADGSMVPVLVGGVRSPEPGQETIAVVSDLTRLREAAESLRAAQTQLLQAQKMEMVGQLAGGVAHDFNNLLTVIHGYADMLRSRLAGDDDGREQAHQILRAADRASSLTRQLLAFSRRQVLDPRDVDLRVLVHDTEQMLQRLIGSSVRLACRLPERLGVVRVDPGPIEQVIVNLVVNARDAMPDGGHIEIELADVSVDAAASAKRPPLRVGRYARLRVRDDGCGIAPEALPHIFEPFFTTKEKGKGTGLGLATVYGIVKQSGGFIFVESHPGDGTCVDVLLPIVGEGDQPASPRGAGESAAPLARTGPAS